MIFDVELLNVGDQAPTTNVFREIDQDQDKQLSRDEVSEYLKKQMAAADGAEGGDDIKQMMSDHEKLVEEIFQHEDKDKNGYISHDEFTGPKHDELWCGTCVFVGGGEFLGGTDSRKRTRYVNILILWPYYYDYIICTHTLWYPDGSARLIGVLQHYFSYHNIIIIIVFNFIFGEVRQNKKKNLNPSPRGMFLFYFFLRKRKNIVFIWLWHTISII